MLNALTVAVVGSKRLHGVSLTDFSFFCSFSFQSTARCDDVRRNDFGS